MELEKVRETLSAEGFAGPHKNPLHDRSETWTMRYSRNGIEPIPVWANVYYMQEMIATWPSNIALEFVSQVEAEMWTVNVTIFSVDTKKLESMLPKIIEHLWQHNLTAREG